MRKSLFLPLIIFTLLAALGFTTTRAGIAQAETNYIEIIESSCKKSCVGGKDELSFCASYCHCVGREVKALSKNRDVLAVLKQPQQKDLIANRCSGTTAVKFFNTACRDKCDGVEKCGSYCACIENKVKAKRTIAQVGDFFIRLGKNEAEARVTMKEYELSCDKQ